MDSILPIIPIFLCPFIITLSLIYPIKKLAYSLDLVDYPDRAPHTSHTDPKPYGGAIAIALGVSLSLFLLLPEITRLLPGLVGNDAPWSLSVIWLFTEFQAEYTSIGPLLFCCFVIVVIGLIDDLRGLSPFIRFIIQLTTALSLIISQPIFCLNLSEIPFIDIATTALWIVLLTNAFNFLDNMDGLSAGLGAICSVFIGYMGLLVGDFSSAFLAFILFGSLCGFLVFNLPPASIYLGDAGGLGLGFMIGALTVRLTHMNPISFDPILQISPLFIVSIPVYDVITVTLIRLKSGKPPWIGDKNHVSHRLVSHGLSKKNTILILYSILFLLSIPSLLSIHPSGNIQWLWITPVTIAILSCFDLYKSHIIFPK